MSFKVGDTVRYIAPYPYLNGAIGKVVGFSDYVWEYIVDFEESGFIRGHNGNFGENYPNKRSCWYCGIDEIKLVRRKLMVYYKKENSGGGQKIMCRI